MNLCIKVLSLNFNSWKDKLLIFNPWARIIEGSVEETLKAKGQTSMFLKQRGNEAYVPIHCLVGKPAILFSAVSCVASHDTDSDKHTNSLSFMFHLSSVC